MGKLGSNLHSVIKRKGFLYVRVEWVGCRSNNDHVNKKKRPLPVFTGRVFNWDEMLMRNVDAFERGRLHPELVMKFIGKTSLHPSNPHVILSTML